MKNQLVVPKYKFQEMLMALSCQSLAEHQKALGTVLYLNKEYVITGAMGNGKATGYEEIYGNRVEDLIVYKGDLKPLKHSEHQQEIDLKRRERGYQGQLIKFGSRQLVMCEAYIFKEGSETGQTKLF